MLGKVSSFGRIKITTPFKGNNSTTLNSKDFTRNKGICWLFNIDPGDVAAIDDLSILASFCIASFEFPLKRV